MKKITTFLLIYMLCVMNVCAEDVFVYIRKQTKITNHYNSRQLKGRSDAGDIVEITRTGYKLSDIVKNIYLIVTVTGVNKHQMGKILKRKTSTTYRRFHVIISELGGETSFNKNKFIGLVHDKTTGEKVNFTSVIFEPIIADTPPSS